MTTRETALRAEGVRIAKNSVVLGLGDALTMALGFVTTLLVTDYLGTSYGLFIGAQRFVALFLVVAQFGLSTFLVRSVATDRDSAGALLGTVLFLRVLLGAAFALLVVGGALFLDYLPQARWLLMAFIVIEFAGVLTDAYVAVCQGLESMVRVALIGLARSAAACIGVIAAIVLDGGMVEIVAVYLGARVLQLAAAVASTRGKERLVLSVRWGQLTSVLRQASAYLVITIGYIALRSLDVIMLSKLSTVSEVARYGAALNFLDALLIAPLLVQRALLPTFSRLVSAGRASSVGVPSVQVFSIVIFPTAVGLGVLARQAVLLYPSGQFENAANVLSILAVGFFCLGVITVCATLLTGAGRLRDIIVGYAMAISVQTVVNALSIPRYGAVGAAWGTVAATAVLSVWLVARLGKIDISVPLSTIARHALCAAIMGLAVHYLRDLLLPIPLLAGAGVYFAVLWTVVPEDGLERKLGRELLSWLRRRRSRS